MVQAARRTRQPDGARSATSGQSSKGGMAGILCLLFTLATIISSIVAVVIWMNDVNRVPLAKLVVTGERRHISDNEIRQAILSMGTPGTFMSQDVNVLQRQIERLAWVKQVSIRKQWPDILKIHLVEYQPFARWNDLQLVDQQGVVFNATDIKDKALPLLYGPVGSEAEVIEGWRKMSNTLKVIDIKLKAASMTPRRAWQLVTRDDIRIELGRTDTKQRLERLIDLYPVIMQQAASAQMRIDYVDLRYDVGAAIKRSPAPFAQPLSDQQQHQPQAKR